MTLSERNMALLRASGRVISAALVAYFFIMVLLVATAQQKVVDALSDQDVGFDYSVAIDYYFGKTSLKAVRGENTKSIKTTTAQIRQGNDKLADANQRLLEQVADLRGDLARLRALGCGDQDFAPDAPADPAALLAAASSTQHCVAEESDEDPRLKHVSDEVNSGADSVRASLDSVAGINREIDDEKDHLGLLEDERKALSSQSDEAGKASGIIAILRVFEDSSWPLASQLVYVPPALMAIILAFASGLFGALLITLVIFVYPDSKFKFTKSASYGGRILLGGLIALGVFVLLFSGVAVLGGSESNANSHNLMAYAAIGILSGMFSDQAAGWLSEKSAFGKPDNAPDAPPTPPPAQIDEG
ncbi:MAG TPA: hypothetical protein VIT45_07070 [Allosphingosinicella sp.]